MKNIVVRSVLNHKHILQITLPPCRWNNTASKYSSIWICHTSDLSVDRQPNLAEWALSQEAGKGRQELIGRIEIL